MRTGRDVNKKATSEMKGVSGFFDRHERFMETSTTSVQRGRLNLRYRAIFEEYAQHFEDKRVLDIASHDGRWSQAALSVGASHVSGVEARQELVESARENLLFYGNDANQFDFRADDAIDSLHVYRDQIDVALCLGFLYHTLRYNELFAGIRDSGASHLIIDTMVKGNPKNPVIHLFAEKSEREGNAVRDRLAYSTDILVGRPSVAAVERMAGAHGFDLVRYSDWESLLGETPEAEGIGDYRVGRRVTALFARN